MKLYIVYRNNGYIETGNLDYIFPSKEDAIVFSKIIDNWNSSFKIPYIDFRKKLREISRESIPKNVGLIQNVYDYTQSIVNDSEPVLVLPADDDDIFSSNLLYTVESNIEADKYYNALYKFNYQRLNLTFESDKFSFSTGSFDIETNHVIYDSRVNLQYINEKGYDYNSDSLNVTHCALDEYYKFLSKYNPDDILHINEIISMDIKGAASISLLFPFWDKKNKYNLLEKTEFDRIMRNCINNTINDKTELGDEFEDSIQKIISLYGEL